LLLTSGSRIFFFSLLLALTPITPHSQEPTHSLPPPIRVSVAEISLGVAVSDASGAFVRGLQRNDFRVLDNGVERPIVGFHPDDESGNAILLLETGPAAFFNKQYELRAAEMLLTTLAPQDRVAIVCYSRSPSLLVDLTSDRTEVRAALEGLNFTVGFGELNLVSSVVATLDWLAALPGKKTIVLLSSGVDSTPQVDWPLLRQMIQSSDVRILAVSVSEEIRQPVKGHKPSPAQRELQKHVRAEFAVADQTLREIAEPTGGHAYFPKTKNDFDQTFRSVAQSVNREYRLTITPSPPDGQTHVLEVKVGGFRRTVDFRRGYFVPLAAAN
jgi:Ca-activated chloride channel homolog